MKYIFTIIVIMIVVRFFGQAAEKQELFKPPIPTELMIGNDHTLFKMVVTKPITQKIKFFNLLNYEVPHADLETSIFLNQTLVLYNFTNTLSAGLGVNLKTFGGLKPILSVMYAKFSKSVGIIIQPTIELHNEGAKELFFMFEYVHQNKKQIQPYFRVDALNTWKSTHDFSFINPRIGINRRGLRFGPAANFQFFGTDGFTKSNLGGFVNIMIP